MRNQSIVDATPSMQSDGRVHLSFGTVAVYVREKSVDEDKEEL